MHVHLPHRLHGETDGTVTLVMIRGARPAH
jgi:hypothetical protein